MNRILMGICLSTLLSACEVGIVTPTPNPADHDDAWLDPIEEDTAQAMNDTARDTAFEDTESELEDTGEDLKPLTDFLQVGPYSVSAESRTASVTNCSNMSYSIYSPDGTTNPPTVILGHGFARGADVMNGWANHLSSWGVEVLLPTLCHYNVFAGVDHEMNGQNMKELVDLHGATNAVYAGHSAGGLAAIIAASQDSSAAGVVGLDTTDTEDVPGVEDYIGLSYAPSVNCPAYALIGEPSTCNSNNNGLGLFRMMSDYSVIKINSADHCDFENPTDFVCELSCENSTAIFEDSEISEAIITLGTAAIISLAGISEDGERVWSEEGLENWIASGLISELE
ncbi:MAG: hypothetical protein VX966_01945 [Chloroflexota bacterium]|nr:hypothetical protein [Chloroflexota bacterium]